MQKKKLSLIITIVGAVIFFAALVIPMVGTIAISLAMIGFVLAIVGAVMMFLGARKSKQSESNKPKIQSKSTDYSGFDL